MFLVHSRRANELIQSAPPSYSKQLSQILSSTVQSRMAIADAHQRDFASALDRMRGTIKERQPLGEAGVEIGRLQLRTDSTRSRNAGIQGARATLELMGNQPRSCFLARDIAIQLAQNDFAKAVQWASDVQDTAQKAAILAGISSGLKQE